jgi:hypothetical protein
MPPCRFFLSFFLIFSPKQIQNKPKIQKIYQYLALNIRKEKREIRSSRFYARNLLVVPSVQVSKFSPSYLKLIYDRKTVEDHIKSMFVIVFEK